MIIILAAEATTAQRDDLLLNLKGRGYGVHLSEGVERTIVGVIGTPERDKSDLVEHFEALAVCGARGSDPEAVQTGRQSVQAGRHGH